MSAPPLSRRSVFSSDVPDRALRRANRFFDVVFLVGDGYLAAVFAWRPSCPA
jgi:hypothetical protein